MRRTRCRPAQRPGFEDSLALLLAALLPPSALGGRRAWRGGAGPRWGWIGTNFYLLAILLTLSPVARRVARATRHEGTPTILAQLCGTAATAALLNLLQTLWNGNLPLSRTLSSNRLAVAVAGAQLATFARTPRAVGTWSPLGAPAIAVPYRAIYGAYQVAICSGLVWLAWISAARHPQDRSLRLGFMLQAGGWCGGITFGVLYALGALRPEPFGRVYARAVGPLSLLITLLLTVGDRLPRVALRWRAVTTYDQLWPLWSFLMVGSGHDPLDDAMRRRRDHRVLRQPERYLERLLLDIEGQCRELRIYLAAEDLRRIDARLARAGIAGIPIAAARDAACIVLATTRRIAGGRQPDPSRWGLGAPHEPPYEELRYLRQVEGARQMILSGQAPGLLPDDETPDNRGEHHDEDVEGHQRESKAEVLATGDAERGQH